MIKIEILDTTIPTDGFGYAVSPIDSWTDALMTKLRSVVHLPTYGTLFPTRKHRTLNDSSMIDIRRDFKDACNFDPRLSFQKAFFDLSEMHIGTVKFNVHLNVGVISGVLSYE